MNTILNRKGLVMVAMSLLFISSFLLSAQILFAQYDASGGAVPASVPSSAGGATGASASGSGGATQSGPVAPLLFNIPNPFGTQSFTLFDFVKRIVALATQIAIPVIILLIIYAGFEFVRAQGAPEAINKAKDTLLYTLIGAGIIFGANVIALAVEATVKNLIQ